MIPKFRAWLIGQEYMAEIEAIAFRGDGNVDVYTSLSGNDFYTVGEECELIQSTGLCDKNGVEIFEGDVVAYNGIRDFRLCIQRAFGGTYIAVNGKTTELLKYINEGFVIIGNIYANPELYHFPDAENMVTPR